jgi:hypothetical protein
LGLFKPTCTKNGYLFLRFFTSIRFLWQRPVKQEKPEVSTMPVSRDILPQMYVL